MQQSDLENLKNMFIKFDISQDGFLSQDELRHGMFEIMGPLKASITDWAELIDSIDSNNDGKIDYGEFITAAVNRQNVISD